MKAKKITKAGLKKFINLMSANSEKAFGEYLYKEHKLIIKKIPYPIARKIAVEEGNTVTKKKSKLKKKTVSIKRRVVKKKKGGKKNRVKTSAAARVTKAEIAALIEEPSVKKRKSLFRKFFG